MERADLLSHLTELRKRVMLCFLVVAITTTFAWFFDDQILSILIQPLKAAMDMTGGTRRLIMTGLTEGFVTHFKVACFAGFFASIPFILYQGWKFIAPGLYLREKRLVWPFLAASPFMFVIGACFVYYLVIPNAWHFFLSFQSGAEATGLAIETDARINEYLNLIMSFLISFGLVFQLPIVLVLLGNSGVITAEMLRKQRRMAILIAFVAGAIFTPPDIMSQFFLAIPIILLYELSIVIIAALRRQPD